MKTQYFSIELEADGIITEEDIKNILWKLSTEVCDIFEIDVTKELREECL